MRGEHRNEKNRITGVLIFPFVLGRVVSLTAREEKGITVFISADMGGFGGVEHADQVSSTGKDYDRARRWMTDEVNAAIEGKLVTSMSEHLDNCP